ncbi:MAG: ABC transporter substrate-binding protein [Rhizobiales bacterium]|nr:ABC transporter substrate-binding protein [Hyphomicrobiales bacterium]
MPITINRRKALGGAAAFGLATSLSGLRASAQEPRVKIRIGLVPLISSGPIFIAQAKKFFEKVNLDAELKFFADGALAMPALVAGELDLTASTLNAGVFNTVAKGAPFKLILDRGIEKPGFGSMSVVASNAMVEAGFTSVDKGAMLKGKRIAIQAPGSIDQYLIGRMAQKAGLDPRTDLNWSSGMPYPEIVKIMGAGQADVAQIPVPLAFLAEKNKVGKIIGTGADVEPNTQLACWVMSSKFLSENKSAAIRFAMVHTHASRIFTKAAASKDAEVVKIIAEATRLPPPLIESAAPRWTWFDENGAPNVQSVMAQYKFLSDSMKLVTGKVTEEMLFDLTPAKEAAARLRTANPFT